MYSCGHEDNPVLQEKADALNAAEGSRPQCAMASIEVTTGPPEAEGHVLKGVTRELGRSNCLLV